MFVPVQNQALISDAERQICARSPKLMHLDALSEILITLGDSGYSETARQKVNVYMCLV